jgi:hypothetical protein
MYWQNHLFRKKINNNTGITITFSHTKDFKANTEFRITNGLSQIKAPVKAFQEDGIINMIANRVEKVLKFDNLRIFLIQAMLPAV